MPIRDCTVLAVEGTKASGKTTLMHALVAHYREQGVHATSVDEAARHSPYVDDIVLHGAGGFDLTTELDLYAAQLSTQLRAARNHELLITDKTVMNVTAYGRLVLNTEDTHTAAVLDALDTLSHAWATSAYDTVIYLRDRYQQNSGGDRYRDKVLDLQAAVDHSLRRACRSAGVRVLELPTGLDTAARVQWISQQVTTLGLLPQLQIQS